MVRVTPSRWSKVADAAIARAVTLWREGAGSPYCSALNNDQYADVTKAIDAAYPFGARSRYPYRVWLRIRKEWLGRLRSEEAAAPTTTLADDGLFADVVTTALRSPSVLHESQLAEIDRAIFPPPNERQIAERELDGYCESCGDVRPFCQCVWCEQCGDAIVPGSRCGRCDSE